MMTDDERKEALAHRDVLLDIRAVLTTSPGMRFIKYLFREFEVGQLPPLGIEGSLLMDKLGSLRAGSALFVLVAEANAELAAKLLAEIEKEKYVQIYKDIDGQG